MDEKEIKLNENHLWVRSDGFHQKIGISDYAQQELGEIVYVDLPDIGDVIEKGESFGEIESTKTVSELIAPVSGEVVEINENLEENPTIINEDPYGDGWLIAIEMSDPEELENLMDLEEYEKFIEEEEQ
jgi:glycine cleavage system H protein